MRTMPVVAVEEGLEPLGALGGGMVRVGVSPLAQRGLNEPLGLALGLWGIRAGETMLEAALGHGGPHGLGAVTGAVVGVDAPDLDAEALEVGERGVQESNGTLGRLIGQ